ncbi:uncharacterized protein LOC109946424 [Prunus persica]|uniref:uncharacterized protein LOC109946424 n=1 Tax=Prunus persica TaxID=3760 RepID=UPI0009AB5EEB|nr:uncharacterized protein LOC109946424 [Prunus persica]
MKFRGNARIVFRLPGSSSKVPEWFTFRNYLDNYDESKFDNLDHDDRSVCNYELPIEIPSASPLDNTKLVLCVVWEITESIVSPCSLEFAFQSHRRDEWRVSGGETEAENVWLECIQWWDCIPLFLHDQLMPPIFRVTVSGKGLRVKSIGAHLVHNSMSRDYDDYYPGKHIDENGLDDILPTATSKRFLYDSGLAIGRPVGSDSFKTLEALPKTEDAPSSSAASKQQASASVPGALFEEKPQSANDAWRKLHLDPLLMTRQREQETLSRIKNNPVQMAMIHNSVDLIGES